MKKIWFSIFCITSVCAHAQTDTLRTYTAKRTTAKIKIDGSIDDPAWKDANLATNFIEFRPNPGGKESDANKTEVWVLYDNISIYVAGYCHEASRDSMTTELVGRDRLGSNDFAGIILDTYHDRINATGFFVTPLGEQFDTKYGSDGEDESWNGVWDSESKIVADGWTFEMRIPYSALRFNKSAQQTWGMNFFRARNSSGKNLTWNMVDPKKNGFVNQFGDLTGLENIQSPLRLQFSPYFSSYLNNDGASKTTSTNVNGGLDIKYGINESFTLDVTAIPDFGQVQSDNQVLNLSPFEVQYNENRAFFTEGAELFNKGYNGNNNGGGGTRIFYSRRIGGSPLHQYDINSMIGSNETVIKNPSETKLLNAIKLSGRTKSNLGIGLLNAIVQPAYAIVKDNTSNKEHEVETSPLTNYNMIVFDQSLKNNSSISFLNTNVWRNGADYDANVAQALVNLNNKKNTYNFSSQVSMSSLLNVDGKNINGFKHSTTYGKTGGNFRFAFTQELTDEKYDPNDFGIQYQNNYLDHYAFVGYRFLKPGKWYNRIGINYNLNYSRRFKPDAYQNFSTNVNGNINFKNLMYGGMWLNFNAASNDFYEPRIEGMFFRRPQSLEWNLWFGTNEAKKYSINPFFYFNWGAEYAGNSWGPGFSQRYRFNDHLSIAHDFNLGYDYDQTGFTRVVSNKPVFAKRDRQTIENTLVIKYNFNNRMGITTRIRHYFSSVDNKEFYNLNPDGMITAPIVALANTNQNYNAFNVDMNYFWQFAPGSFINVNWKNATQQFTRTVENNYFKNLSNTLGEPQNNSFSFKIIYFIDYLSLRKKS